MDNINKNLSDEKVQAALDNFVRKMQDSLKAIIEEEKNQPEISGVVKIITLNFQTLQSSIEQLKKHIHTHEGKFEQIKIIQGQIETFEVSFELYRNEIEILKTKYDELKKQQIKDKKDTDEAIERDRKENKQDKVSMNIKLDQIITQQQLFEQRQTSNEKTTAEGFNIAHERMNIQQRDLQEIRLDIRKVHEKLNIINSTKSTCLFIKNILKSPYEKFRIVLANSWFADLVSNTSY